MASVFEKLNTKIKIFRSGAEKLTESTERLKID